MNVISCITFSRRQRKKSPLSDGEGKKKGGGAFYAIMQTGNLGRLWYFRGRKMALENMLLWKNWDDYNTFLGRGGGVISLSFGEYNFCH